MTVGEQKHMAVTEHQLCRIAEALEGISERIDGIAQNKKPDESPQASPEKEVEGESQFYNETVPLIENAVEIAWDCLAPLQEYFQKERPSAYCGRQSLITGLIIPWAKEAKERYVKAVLDGEEIYYYDFIEAFTEEKFKAETGTSLKCGGENWPPPRKAEGSNRSNEGD